MFKKILSVAVMATALFFTSCEKENINVDPPGTGSSANDGFNWSGEAPFSVEIDGSKFSVDKEKVEVNFFPNSMTIDGGGTTEILYIMFSDLIKEGDILEFPKGAFINYDDNNPEGVLLVPVSGKVKITQNTPAIIEGYFYATVKNLQTGQLKQMTKGYFKVNKN